MKHTPGPWRAVIGGDQPQVLYRGIICLVEHSQRRITVVSDGPTETVPETEWEANARLIAAAPEMYEALRALIDKGITGKDWKQARAVLAKVEG